MLPLMVPTVQEKALGAEESKEILVLVPLHIVAVLAVVTVGAGLTVTLIVEAVPEHTLAIDIGVTK